MSSPKLTKTSCEREGHAYQTLDTYRKIQGPDTLVFTVFFCTKCCDVQERQTAVWKDFIPKANKNKEKEKNF